MRIHLNLPSASNASPSSSSTRPPSSVPPQLTALSPCGELLLIELQGSLEIDHQDPRGGQVLGTLSFEQGREDRPVLMVSHHRLEGRFVDLVRPLAVLEKKHRTKQMAESESGDGVEETAARVLGQLDDNVSRTGERTLEDNDTTPTKRSRMVAVDITSSITSSPPPAETPQKKPRRDALDFSSSPPYRLDDSPHASRATKSELNQEDGEDRIDERDVDGEDEEEERQTSVYYDVVNIIKRKILFSKRPEPIVKLDIATTPTKLKP